MKLLFREKLFEYFAEADQDMAGCVEKWRALSW